MTSTASSILAAILEEPDCDLHRLAYADWLEEQGEVERSEFIRVQIEVMKIPDCGYLGAQRWCSECPCCCLKRRAEELCREGYAVSDWHMVDNYTLYPVPEDWYRQIASFYLRRGFVESVVCSWPWWEQHHEEVLQQQPVRKVYMTTTARGIDAMVGYNTYCDGPVLNMLATRWPRLEFVLPGGGQT